ncbi:putative metal-dependent hydrolase [Deinococcus cavernae]|uniref:Putative metal-dependent hydrolase D3875_06415 n=1 Tax=Deinococcus cavernae TaxID=2320857 RepID=A0A418V584_9DEIO|nr:putative metal-dependent hydrolase [Deinococcus cavernae]RJF71258.1 putative metal-dependent hydrolase [Deinococcus cavernae]
MTADPRYPLGPAPQVTTLTPPQRREGMAALRALPEELQAALAGLGAEQLDTPYREGGWTLRQLAHHVADSHLNAYVRTRLALTEMEPTITPYEEQRWAELPDRHLDPSVSLELLRALHTRWVATLDGLEEADWQKTFHHPVNGPTTLEQMLAYYAWHGRHHTAHILKLREKRGW